MIDDGNERKYYTDRAYGVIMKRIAFIDYDMSVRGGVESVTCSLANALCEEYKVYVLSIHQSGAMSYELDPRVEYSCILPEAARLREARKNIRRPLKELLKKERIETVVLQGNYAGFVCSSVRLRGVKKIFCDHGALMNSWNEKLITFIRFIDSVTSSMVITLTERSEKDYIRKFHLPAGKVVTVPNWIEEEYFVSEGYSVESRKIVSAGRLGPEKGFDNLIRAFAPTAEKHPDWHLDIFGDGEEREKIEELIADYGLEDNVTLKGSVPGMKDIYREYAFYVLPSYKEGMPLVLLEAKANRLPVISFDILTGPAEIVRDGIDGILIPPYDIEQMSGAICRLIEDPELRQKMSGNAGGNLDKFSKNEILGKWRKVL